MKSLGWNFFFSLLVADVVAVVMVLQSVKLNAIFIVSGVVFVAMLIVLLLAHSGRRKMKQREDEANAKIAELQDHLAERDKDGAAL